jgi:phage head maturation protease
MEEQRTTIGAVKLIGMDDSTATVGGYGVVFGGRDLEGDTFGPDTDYKLDLVPAKLVFYDHTLGDVTHDLGRVTNDAIKVDDKGLWIEAQLDRSAAYVDEVLKLVEAGVLGWSSGSIAHLARAEKGMIKSWPIVEFSLTPTPAEPRTIGVERIKALAAVYPNLEALQEAPGNGAVNATATEAEAVEIKSNNEEVNDMSDEQTTTAPAADNSEVLAAIGQLAESVKAVSGRIEAIENKPVNEQPPAVNIVTKSVDTRQYDNIETGALALGLSIVKAAGKPVSESLYKAVAMRLEGDADMNRGPMSVKSYNEAARAFKSFARGIKANELVYSTQTDAANEWIGVAYSGELWDLVRNATMIWNRIPEIPVPMGVESVVIPTLEASPTFYKVAEATAQGANPGATTNTVTTSKPTTGNATMTLSKLGAGVTFTGEVNESSVLPFAQYLRNDLVQTHAEYMDAIALNGDTDASATTNINDIAGTPAATDWFLTANGFRKSALVTNTANSRDGGSLTSADFIETVKLMGAAGREAMDRNRVSFVLDPATHWAAMQLADVKTRDVFNGATIENGMLASIWGYEVLVSAEMHRGSTSLLANSAGKVDLDTQGNNTLGAILAVRWDQWRRGEMRRITIEAERVPRADATEITALSRFGLVQRFTEGAAISYNLTV